MPRVKLSVDAENDLRSIGQYISQHNQAAAKRWVAKIRKKYRMLGKHPNLGERCDQTRLGTRRTFVGNYVIYYYFDGEAIIISRIVRGERDINSI